jgi:hypothetical protein
MSRTLASLLLAAGAGPAAASGLTIDNLQSLSQSDFHLLAEDLGAALSYKPLIPAAPLGITGFDIGIGVTATSLKNTDVVQKAVTGGTVGSVLPIPTLRVDKGLPLDLDIGLAYGKAPDSNISFYGGELRWAILPGSIALPAVALRVAATALTGVDQLKFNTQSVDVSVSKGFALATPYAGVGEVWVHATPQGIAALASDSFVKTKLFGGVNLNFGLANFLVEVDTVGSVPSYGAKIGVRF